MRVLFKPYKAGVNFDFHDWLHWRFDLAVRLRDFELQAQLDLDQHLHFD